MLLRAADLEFAYGRQDAASRRRRPASLVLKTVSMTVPHASVVGLLGPNGSGKTTLLKVLAGALRPTRGTIEFDGVPLATLSRRALARRLAVVPQETHTAFDYTALEMVLMGRYAWLGAFEVEGPADYDAAMAALDATHSTHLATRLFPTLSGGEKQRVVIASALAQLDARADRHAQPPAERPLLLLDEPTASLDLRHQLECADLIEQLHTSRGVTMVLSTHDIRLVRRVCDAVVLLREGHVLASGPTPEVLTPPLIAELYGVGESLVTDLLQ